MRVPSPMNDDQVHEFGVNVVLDDIRTHGYAVSSITSDRNLNPQIIAHKNGQLVHVIVRTAVYPRSGTIESFNLGLQILDDAYSKNAKCFFASVGIANAYGSTELEMSIPTHGAGYFVAYNGIEELTPVMVRQMTGSNPPLPTYDRDGKIVGSVKKGVDGRYTIVANDGADGSSMLMSLCLIFADERDVSQDQKEQFSLWAHLPTNAWTETHQRVFAHALLHYFMEARANGGNLPASILKVLQNFPPQALEKLRYPLTDEIRAIFLSMFSG